MKNITDTLTPLMDKAREITGLTEKINIAQLTSLMDHFDLHVNPNLMDVTENIVKVVPDNPYFSLQDIFTISKSGTYTFSFCTKTDGKAKHVRVTAIEWKTNKATNVGVFPITSDRQSYTFTIPEDDYDLIIYASGWDEKADKPVTFYDCKLEVGDLATPLNPVGGVVNLVLTATFERRCAA